MLSIEFLAEQYGYLGLFLASYIASTLIPFSTESLMFLATGLGLDLSSVVGVVTVASVFGGLTDYLIGMTGNKIIGGRIDQEKIDKYKDVITKGGAPIIFMAAFTPLPFQVFSVSAGFLKMNVYAFFGSSFAGRLIRFSLLGVYGNRVLEIFRAEEWTLFIIFTVSGLVVIVLVGYLSWLVIEKKKNGEDVIDIF